MDRFELGKKIIYQLEANGYQAYFVGGFVRDYLMNNPINDIDIATNAHPENVISIFKKTILTGIKHGTVTVMIENTPFEVTTYRTEGKYLDYRHPSSITFVSSLHEDLSRRDFTINAMAMSEDGEIIDPFQGITDIQKKSIVAVGQAETRFLEDPLRMIRAIRFAATLNFVIEKKTREALLKHANYLRFIAVERIKVELDKIFQSKYIDIGLELLFESNLIRWIKNVDEKIFLNINIHIINKLVTKTSKPNLRWFFFLRSLHYEERMAFMKNLHFSKKEINSIRSLFFAIEIVSDNLTEINIKECLVQTNIRICHDIVDIMFIDQKINAIDKKKLIKVIDGLNRSLTIREVKDLDISGKDLIDFFDIKGGPWVRHLLEKLLDMVIYHHVKNEKNYLLKKASEIKKEINHERND